LARSPHPQASGEVIVIGAGAAGLAAAAVLACAGRAVLVLEARDRIGGRCWTRRFPGLPLPVELGAEFIHGRPEVTLSLLKRAGAVAVDSTRTQKSLFEGRLRAIDAFAQAQKAMRRASLLKTQDVSFAAFLSRQKDISSETRSYARMMVEGFDAADPARASARAIVEEWASGAQLGAQSRPLGGYGPLLDTLAREAVSHGGRIQLQTAIKSVRWKKGTVEVEGEFRGEGFRAAAPKAVVTLPLGVLQAGSVRFTPGLEPKRQALKKLVSGPVVKIALRFASAFWEQDHPEVAFFHSPASAFPTFWTPLPMHAPVLIGWAGGPKADRLFRSSEEQVVGEAMKSLKSALGNRCERELAAFHMHNWQQDPFSRGAYSYVGVGGDGARQALQAPLADTLYFAGEATDTQDEAGTVAGALQSGIAAARHIAREMAA
jgi:monoamine oxidase